MTQRLVHRPARTRPPEPDLKAIELIPPPRLPDSGAGVQGVMQMAMPIMGGAGSLVMLLSNSNPVMLIAGSIMLGVTVIGGIVMFIGQRTGQAKRTADMRRRYLEYLEGVRSEVTGSTDVQREIAEHHHPAPETLPDLARDTMRLWERRPTDPDFLVVRIGTGSSPLWQRVTAPPAIDPLAEPDIVTAAGVHRIVERDRMVRGMPACLPISGRVTVVGPAPLVRQAVTAGLAQLVTFHGAEEVHLYTLSARHAAGWLDWLKWLPHALSDEEVDATAPRRRVASDPAELVEMLSGEFSRRVGELTRSGRSRSARPSSFGPALVVVVDALAGKAPDILSAIPADIEPARINVHCLTLVADPADEPEKVDVRVTVGEATPADPRTGERPGLLVQDLRRLDEERDEVVEMRRAMGAPAGDVDLVDEAVLQGLVRELTAVRLVEESATAAPLESTLTLSDLTGVEDPGSFDPRTTWTRRAMPDFLNVPFGLGPSGEKVRLDLKENALGGMGPHGLCVGATGSGKSEVLRTLVLCLAINHPPERLALVLVDYKGGATFAGLEETPHCAAMISNLSDDDGLVDRLHDALFGEMKRRQQLLAQAGNVPNITEYNRRRDAQLAEGGEEMEPLPNLFCVIDEFGELLTAKPDFIELFLAIGRIGRSIGVHLLLASQRLEEGRLRGLESYLSYRLGLRTFNPQESRAVLGVPDAYELPPIPGSGYLAVDTTIFQRFKAGYVSGTYRPPVTGETVIDTDPIVAPFPLFNDTEAFLESQRPPDEEPSEPVDEDADALLPTVLDVAVGQMAEVGTRTAQIWLPPLPKRLDLDAVGGAPRTDPVLGLRLATGGNLRVPIGLLDKPAEQKQEPYLLDLSASGGHLAIIGAPQTGKSVLLRTIVTSAALTHMPGEVAFYCLDLGGGALRVLEGLPHVAGVAARLDTDRVRRTVAEVATALAEREALFSQLGIDSVEQMRERYRTGRLRDLDVADIFLVIDNWPVLRADFEDLADLVGDLGTRGPGYGIHLVMTMGRWADVRTALQAAIGTKLELRINDPIDSTIGRKFSANLRADTPGRAIVDPGLQVHVCLPTLAEDRAQDPALAGEPQTEDPFAVPAAEPEQDEAGAVADALAALAGTAGGDGADDGADDAAGEDPPALLLDPGSGAPDGHGATDLLINRIAQAWPGERVPVIRMLPTLVDHAELVARTEDPAGPVIGVDGTELKPVVLDFTGIDQHLLVFGDSESGKTSLLRAIVSDLTSRYTDEEVVFAVFDIRRTLLDVVPEDYLGAYAGTAAIAGPTAAAIAAEVGKRLPPDDVTAAQLRARSWWQGPEIVLLVDDYDLLNSSGPGPLAPFVEFLPQAKDLGLHLILCRRSGGASRALFEPLLQRLRETGATGLLLSGDRQEGQLFPGVHLQQQPPGRGTLVRRGRKPMLVQLAYRPDPVG